MPSLTAAVCHKPYSLLTTNFYLKSYANDTNLISQDKSLTENELMEIRIDVQLISFFKTLTKLIKFIFKKHQKRLNEGAFKLSNVQPTASG